MPWITQIGMVNSKTVSPKQYESAKVEREFILSFAPGELKSTDEASIKVYLRDMGELLKLAVDDAIGPLSDVRESSKSKSPPASTPQAPRTETTAPSESKKVLKDKFGNVWPEMVECKGCGTIVEVQENSKGGPMAICDGTDENNHGPHFLKMDGELGAVFVPRNKE